MSGARRSGNGEPDQRDGDGAPPPERGRVLRPRPVVLPDDALLPPTGRAEPPARLTHELTRPAPFYLTGDADAAPAGTLAAGARVAARVTADVTARGRRGGARCRVVRDDGLTVYVPCDALRAL